MYNILRHTKHSLFPTEFHKQLCLSVIEPYPGRLLPYYDLIELSEKHSYTGRRNTQGFFPRDFGNLIFEYLCINQRFLWLFKRLLFYRILNKRQKNRKNLIANEFDLLGDTLPDGHSRRILELWDNHSGRYYRFPWNDIYNIFKSSLIIQEPIHPKNPYTNLRFTTPQLVRIREFFIQNCDRLRPTECSIMAYLRWNTINVVHAYNFIYYYEMKSTLINDVPDEKDYQTILLDSIFSKRNIMFDKLPLYEEIRRAFLVFCNLELFTDSLAIPTTKAEYFIFNMSSNLESENYSKIITWLNANEKKPIFTKSYLKDVGDFYNSHPYEPCKDFQLQSPTTNVNVRTSDCDGDVNPFLMENGPRYSVFKPKSTKPNPFARLNGEHLEGTRLNGKQPRL